MEEARGVTEARSLADEALAKADIDSLHRLFMKKCDDLQTILSGIGVMVEEGKTSPRPNDGSINAMRDVSLAAIGLAKEVARRESGDEGKAV